MALSSIERPPYMKLVNDFLWIRAFPKEKAMLVIAALVVVTLFPCYLITPSRANVATTSPSVDLGKVHIIDPCTLNPNLPVCDKKKSN